MTMRLRIMILTRPFIGAVLPSPAMLYRLLDIVYPKFCLRIDAPFGAIYALTVIFRLDVFFFYKTLRPETTYSLRSAAVSQCLALSS